MNAWAKPMRSGPGFVRETPKLLAAATESAWDAACRIADNRLRAILAWRSSQSPIGDAQIEACRANLQKELADAAIRAKSSRHPEDRQYAQNLTAFADAVARLDAREESQIGQIYETMGRTVPPR